MLYIKDVLDPEVNNRYFGVPTRLSEVDGTPIIDNNVFYAMAHNRIMAACLIKCSLARIYNPNKDFNNNAAMHVPVSTTPYLAVPAPETTPHSDCFTKIGLIGNRLLMSNASYNAGAEIKPFVNNKITSNTIRKHLNDLGKPLAGAVKNYAGVESNFQVFEVQKRFIQPAIGDHDSERLVFVDDYDTPYVDQPVYAVDFRAFSIISVDGVAAERFPNPVIHRTYVFYRKRITKADGSYEYIMEEQEPPKAE